MTLDEVMTKAIDPALALLPPRMDSPLARIMLLTIGQQESQFKYRRQLGNGPAKSFWQGERGGGMVHGVRTHPAVSKIAAGLYMARGVAATDWAIWNAIEHDDVLAAALARLLLWTDSRPLPAADDTSGAWALYEDTWRPGRPHPETWAGYHGLAREAVAARDA